MPYYPVETSPHLLFICEHHDKCSKEYKSTTNLCYTNYLDHLGFNITDDSGLAEFSCYSAHEFNDDGSHKANLIPYSRYLRNREEAVEHDS
jgi:hypothetical protein